MQGRRLAPSVIASPKGSGVFFIERAIAALLGILDDLRTTLGDTDHGRAQDAVADDEAGLHDLYDRVVRHFRIRYFEHRLMEIRIELLADRLKLAHAMALQGREHRTLGHLDAFDQGRQAGIAASARFSRNGVQRAAQVIRHRQHVAGEACHR